MSESEIIKIAKTLKGRELEDFLNKHCGDNKSLRARIVGNLNLGATLAPSSSNTDQRRKPKKKSHRKDEIDKSDLDLFDATLDSSMSGDPSATRSSTGGLATGALETGDTVGKYTLVEVIGEGGMGEVWLAHQEKPVTRRVAVKLIKSGMLDRNVIARFEAEQQALAMMNHVNIARVIDGGIARNGSPYFVMEYVDGIPINKFCDQQKLDPESRLRLFISVCEAVQHAHLKGIMHRDLKPSNVLVAMREGKPVVKVIDFGLAKALQNEAKLTDKTMQTEVGQVLGTLQYMSPEQASLDQLDIDTRSDVYSLGVMLYQLLAGSTPLDQQALKQNALLKVLEMIRETDPPRPSSRLDIESEPTESISELRSVKSLKLKQILERDLDWIVMKAIERERDRRYESPSDFADDIARYLDG
jgi:serine/threonine protein kinase